MHCIHRALAVWFAAVCLAGCSSGAKLPVAPNVLRDGSGSAQLRELPPEQQTPEMRIFYITDRNPIYDKNGNVASYGFSRSRHVAYGETTVSLGKDVRWEELVRYSGSPSNSERYKLTVTAVRERGQFAPTLTRLVARQGKLVLGDPEGERIEEREAQAVLSEALGKARQKDVYIFVHGFANSFYDGVLRVAGIWHYVGRRGIAVAYTWPAGRGGLLGYFYDRESGEYTIYHLKRTLRIIAACPAVERVHVIAHSRGTDVVLTALRELNGEYRGAGKDPREVLKLQSLVLAAPDLDRDVFAERFGAENLVGVAGQVVIYGAKEDTAIRLARWLFGSAGRMGTFDPAEAAPGILGKIHALPGLQFVRTEVSGFSSSHAYVFSNPAALSDLVLVLRDQKLAGAEAGRPMKRHLGWWGLDNSYFNTPITWKEKFHAD